MLRDGRLRISWTACAFLALGACAYGGCGGGKSPDAAGGTPATDSGASDAADAQAPAIQPWFSFDWFHPDAPNSMPAGKYNCDHTLQGPSGHQGLITAVVSDGVWQCTGTYKGTHTSDASSATNGTASQPVCKKL